MRVTTTNSKIKLLVLIFLKLADSDQTLLMQERFKIRGIEIGLGFLEKDFEWSFNTNFTQNRGTVN
jgi:hypothetical protein